MSAIELAYERDFSHIPCVSFCVSLSMRVPLLTDFLVVNRILGKGRRPIGYIDVAALKKAWEAEEIDAVSCLAPLPPFCHLPLY
jgi:hypothetical protein